MSVRRFSLVIWKENTERERACTSIWALTPHKYLCRHGLCKAKGRNQKLHPGNQDMQQVSKNLEDLPLFSQVNSEELDQNQCSNMAGQPGSWQLNLTCHNIAPPNYNYLKTTLLRHNLSIMKL